ncbi:MAG: DUF86 domain-containing protein [Acidimicrobiia bacterium]|nr:DUF86 domain-containing protein [Acidimicrobiia bacterium]
MTPAGPDREVVGRRLRALDDALADLEILRDVSVDRLRAEPLTRAAAERLLQVVVDLAIDVNAHLVVTALGRAPATGRESFTLLVDVGAIDQELADRLAPSAGLRNVLVHRYTDIRVELVAAAIGPVLDDFAAYVRAVATHIA